MKRLWLVLAVGGCGFSAALSEQDAASPRACPVSYDRAELDGHRYRVVENHLVRSDARAECERDGGHLLKVETERENTELTHQLGPSDDFWIGLAYTPPAGDYRWDDGATLGYENWSDRPGGRDCVVLYNADGQWDTADCLETLRAVCECDG